MLHNSLVPLIKFCLCTDLQMEGNQILSPKCDKEIKVRHQTGKNKDNYMHWIVHFQCLCVPKL